MVHDSWKQTSFRYAVRRQGEIQKLEVKSALAKNEMRELKNSESARPKSPTQEMLPRQEEFKNLSRILRISRFKCSSLKKEGNFCTLFFFFLGERLKLTTWDSLQDTFIFSAFITTR